MIEMNHLNLMLDGFNVSWPAWLYLGYQHLELKSEKLINNILNLWSVGLHMEIAVA